MDCWPVVLRGLHIVAGSVALLTVIVPWVVRKGGTVHRRVGWVYLCAMGVVSTTSLGLAVLRLVDPVPANDPAAIFLACLGVLAIATGLHGVSIRPRRRRWRRPSVVVSWLALFTGCGLTLFGVARSQALFVIFGVLGSLLAVRQLRFVAGLHAPGPELDREHLRAMGATSIATVTAFAAVNAPAVGLADHELLVWLTPSVLGGVAIALWGRRLRRTA